MQQHRQQPDFKKAEGEALKVLEDNSIINPPVDVYEIASNYGIKIQNVTFKSEHRDIAGFFDFSEKVIYVNNEESFNRNTFTVAHELGHFFLHKKIIQENPNEYQILMRRPLASAQDWKEKEANTFAAHLLVPRKFLDLYKEFATVEHLAKAFIVSPDVIRFRLRHEYGF
jgi:Zn-dependent peptidase ImmA (M78 family)